MGAFAFTELVTVLPNDLHDVYKMKIATGAWWTFLSDGDLDLQTALDIRECRPSAYQLWLDLQEVFRRTKADYDPTTETAKAAWEAAIA